MRWYQTALLILAFVAVSVALWCAALWLDSTLSALLAFLVFTAIIVATC